MLEICFKKDMNAVILSVNRCEENPCNILTVITYPVINKEIIQ